MVAQETGRRLNAIRQQNKPTAERHRLAKEIKAFLNRVVNARK
jgi:hypothetical protein